MARKNTAKNDLGAELDGFLEKNDADVAKQDEAPPVASARRSGARTRKAAHKTEPKTVARNDEIVEGTDAIDASLFAEKLAETVREKNAKYERVADLLNNDVVRAALKEFIDEIGGIHLAYERLALVAPDVKKSTFIRAWKECGYGASSAVE